MLKMVLHVMITELFCSYPSQLLHQSPLHLLQPALISEENEVAVDLSIFVISHKCQLSYRECQALKESISDSFLLLFLLEQSDIGSIVRLMSFCGPFQLSLCNSLSPGM